MVDRLAVIIFSWKPVIASFMGGAAVRPGIEAMKAARIPNYHYPERAVAAFEALVKYQQWRNAPEKKIKRFEVEQRAVKEAISRALEEGRLGLGESDTREIIGAYGFRLPRSTFAPTAGDAVKAAETLYESYTTGDDISYVCWGQTWRAQTFTPTSNHNITRAEMLMLRDSGFTGNVTVSIQKSDGSGHPTRR